MLGDIANICSADCDGTFRHIKEAWNKINQRTLARTGRTDKCDSLTWFSGKADMRQYVFFCFWILEGNIMEFNRLASLRQPGRAVWICNCRLCFQYFKDTLCAYSRTGNHDKDRSDDHKGHQDMYGILKECHHIADLHRSKVNLSASKPDDQDGHKTHQECHCGHDCSDCAIYEDVDSGKISINVIKALFFFLLIIEGTNDQHTGKQFSCDQVQIIDQFLDDAEFRQSDIEGDCHKNNDNDQHSTKYSCHTCITQHLEQRGQTHKRCEQNNSQ